ncbi:Lrp/AsnC family transcriptional regulator [Sporomusa sp.]|uniref:siroheme decarboxylase subunit beta n=1 Tax=Sporomusa sp. TaxID=2078658 RepID=UPI002C424AA7|nr:Lrp/AsnC family transcriptional regulator [Sporomusa sp.]HWR08655.1 Lrp/AsnC family transcriptional regulator [Sporomusa sp.]
MLDNLDKKIIAVMQGEFPLVAEPYKELAQQIGITEHELLERLGRYRLSGQLRKMGAVLRHREVGYAANALCAWIVPEQQLAEVGQLMSGYMAVTHCYARIPQPGWPYNFYTMLHAHTRAECQRLAEELAEATGLDIYTLLFSTREWKKTSMSYFPEYAKGEDAVDR